MHIPRHARDESPNTNPFRVVSPKQGSRTRGVGLDSFHPLIDDKPRPRTRPRWVRALVVVSLTVALAVFGAIAASRVPAGKIPAPGHGHDVAVVLQYGPLPTDFPRGVRP